MGENNPTGHCGDRRSADGGVFFARFDATFKTTSCWVDRARTGNYLDGYADTLL